MLPSWYLITVNIETGEQKVIYETPENVRMEIVESFPGAWLLMAQHGDTPRREYWLYHGEMIPKTDDTPPWPNKASPWDKSIPRPEIYWDQIDPDAEGRATLWHRSVEDAAKENQQKEKAPHGATTKRTAEELGWKFIHFIRT